MATESAMQTFVRETGGWVASQLEACTRCGMCAQACHFYHATGIPEYTPIWKVELLRRAYEQRFTLGGKIRTAIGMEKPITDEALAEWSTLVYEACTMCNKCAMVCPMGIQLGPLIHEVRSAMSESGMVPAELMTAVEKQLDEGSPLGMTEDVWDSRLEWVADEWEVEIPRDVQGADSLVVYTSIEVMKFPGNVAAVAQIMNAAGEKWTVSSSAREVVNFGFYEGNEDHTIEIMNRVFDGAVELGVKRIVVTECGHAYDALRWTAANIMEVPAGIEVVHIVGVMAEFVRTGRIKLKAGANDNDGIITFHDACKIQRRGGLIEEPRELLRILAPTAFHEMTPNREEAICCGGGGGVIAIKDADPQRYAVYQIKEAQIRKVGAQTVTMTCSNCRLQFTDGIAHFGSDLKAAGLTQMVADALET